MLSLKLPLLSGTPDTLNLDEFPSATLEFLNYLNRFKLNIVSFFELIINQSIK